MKKWVNKMSKNFSKEAVQMTRRNAQHPWPKKKSKLKPH
jgi:hypothetical protein